MDGAAAAGPFSPGWTEPSVIDPVDAVGEATWHRRRLQPDQAPPVSIEDLRAELGTHDRFHVCSFEI